MILGPDGLPIAGSANAGVGMGMIRNVGARNAAMFGEDPYVNTYLHFDGKCCFDYFKPDFVDGVTEFYVDSEIRALYEGNYNSVFVYDCSTGNTGTLSKKNYSLCLTKNAETFGNFKMNGNGSSVQFSPPVVTIDSRMIGNLMRFKYGCGAKSFVDGTLSCFISYNGNIITKGQDVPTSDYGYGWIGALSGSPRIGWAFLGSTAYGIGNPSIFDLYSLKFSQSGVITNSLVPALRTDNRPCLFDEITNTRLDWSSVYSGGQITINGPAKYVGV